MIVFSKKVGQIPLDVMVDKNRFVQKPCFKFKIPQNVNVYEYIFFLSVRFFKLNILVLSEVTDRNNFLCYC